MAFLSSSPRTALRDSTGPRAVDSGNTPSRHYRSRRHSKGDDGNGDKHRPKRKDSHQSCSTPSQFKEGNSHRRKASSTSVHPNSPLTTSQTEAPPTLELSVVSQPTRGIALGVPVTTSVVLSLRSSSPNPPSASAVDTSTLFALPTLLTDASQPLDPQLLTSTSGKPYASLQLLPVEVARSFERIHTNSKALGYFSFSGLVIRQSGSFRIRTSLARMSSEGATVVCTTESECVKVERRGGMSGGTVDRRRAGRGVW